MLQRTNAQHSLNMYAMHPLYMFMFALLHSLYMFAMHPLYIQCTQEHPLYNVCVTHLSDNLVVELSPIHLRVCQLGNKQFAAEALISQRDDLK